MAKECARCTSTREASLENAAGKPDTTMNLVLRPGEALVWRWSPCDPVKYHGALYTMPTYPSAIYNGLWEYRPDFSKETWRQGASST